MLESALDYASRGYNVFPCVPRGKAPLTPHGYKDGTTDENQIREWWGKWPSANIGLCTEGLIVIDVDPRNGGNDEWQVERPDLLVPRSRTGNDGAHYFYRDVSRGKSRIYKSIGSGVDVKSAGGYVLAPPSVTENEYRWLTEHREPADPPQWLLDKVIKPEYKPKTIVYGDSDDSDNRPGSVFNRTASWEEVLLPHGWTIVDQDDGELRWRRPGGESFSSATTNYAGTNLLYVFSTEAHPFEADTAYSLFSAYTLLNFDGNYAEAARVLAIQQMSETLTAPQPETYTFEPAFAEGHFIADYISYGLLQTDAPQEYHEAGGLNLVALCTPSSRGSLAPYPGGLTTNLYSVLVGSTTRSRKSTCQRIAQSIAKEVSPFSILSNRATTEALIESLSERSSHATLWTPDEFGVQLSEIYTRTFMQGLEEMLLTLYGGDDYTYQRTKKSQWDNGKVTIYNPHLNILGAATPESLMRAGSTALESGLLPRFAVVYPKVLPEPRPAAPAPSDINDIRDALISRLRYIQTYSKSVGRVTFTEGALDSLNAAESILVGYGNHTARLPTMLFKVAMLSALADLRAQVTEDDATSAVKVVMRWAEGVNNLRPLLSMRAVDVEFERAVQTAKEVFERLAVSGAANRALIARELRLSEDMFSRVERTLIGRAEVKVDSGTWRQ